MPDSPNSKTTSTPDSPNSKTTSRADFAAVDARFTKLEEGQYEIAQTLAVLVALFKAGNEASVTAAGVAPRS